MNTLQAEIEATLDAYLNAADPDEEAIASAHLATLSRIELSRVDAELPSLGELFAKADAIMANPIYDEELTESDLILV